MEIRLAVSNDIKSICKLYSAFFEFHAKKQPYYCRAAEESGEYPQSVIESETEDIIVATEGDDIIGILHIIEKITPPYPSVVPHKYAEIMDIFVTETFRRNGVGKMLIIAAEEWAKSRGLEYLELNVIHENTGAFKFYRRNEFEPVTYKMRRKIAKQ